MSTFSKSFSSFGDDSEYCGRSTNSSSFDIPPIASLSIQGSRSYTDGSEYSESEEESEGEGNSGAEIPSSEIQLGKQIGKGSFGTVYVGTCRDQTVAVKFLHKQDMPEENLRQFRKEVAVSSKLFHPNIVLYMGACSEQGKLMIVTEKLESDLETVLRDKQVFLSLCKRMQMAKECAQGINWLHCSQPVFIHGDIKPSNLLLDKQLRVKICDFNLSGIKREDAHGRKGGKGTPLYMAPELYKGKPITEKSDVYSFGIVLWQLLTREIPYNDIRNVSTDTLLEEICYGERPKIPGDCNERLAKLITACWSGRPAERPTFKEIIAELDKIIIETAIDNPVNRTFWETYFMGMTSVEWTRFSYTLVQWLNLDTEVYENEPTVTQMNLRCLKAILEDDFKHEVSIERFGRVVDCFGELSLKTMDVIRQIELQPWFHGELTLAETNKLLAHFPTGYFVVRISSTTKNCFVISSKDDQNSIRHQRITVDPRTSKVFNQLNSRYYNNMIEFIDGEKENLKLTLPCPGSKFSTLLTEHQAMEYTPDYNNGGGSQ